MSPDAVTIHDLGGDLNPYAYVHGTPLMGVDPDGNYAGWDDLAAFGVGFVTSAVTQYVQNGKVDWSDAFVDGVSAWASLYVGPYGAPAVSAGSYAWKQGLNGQKVTSAGLRDAAVSGAVSGAVSSNLPGTGSALADGVYKGAASGTASYVATSSFHGGPTWKGVGSAAKNGATGGGIGYGVNTAAGTNKELAQKSEGPDQAESPHVDEPGAAKLPGYKRTDFFRAYSIDGPGFDTLNDAAAAALSAAHGATRSAGVEVGGLLYEYKGRYFVGPTIAVGTQGQIHDFGGLPARDSPYVPDGAELAGSYHTHPYADAMPSFGFGGGDVAFQAQLNKTAGRQTFGYISGSGYRQDGPVGVTRFWTDVGNANSLMNYNYASIQPRSESIGPIVQEIVSRRH